MEGATIIISPLIALQKDQVDAISSQPHTAEAAVVNSSIPDQQLRETLDYELSPAFAEESDIELLLELLGDDHARHVLYIEVGSRTRRTVEFGEVA